MVAEPPETLGIAHLTHNGDHEQLDGANIAHWCIALTRSQMMQAEGGTELLVAGGPGDVDLIAEDKKRDVGEHLIVDQAIQLLLNLWETLAIHGVDEKDDTIDLGIVIPPDLTGGGMATQVEGAEPDLADYDFLGRGHLGGNVLGDAVVAQDVHEGGLSGIVEAEEEDFGVLVVQAEVGQGVPKPGKHGGDWRGSAGGEGALGDWRSRVFVVRLEREDIGELGGEERAKCWRRKVGF